MICPNCKKEIPDGTKFCIHCGAKLTGAPENSGAQMNAQDAQPQPEQPQAAQGAVPQAQPTQQQAQTQSTQTPPSWQTSASVQQTQPAPAAPTQPVQPAQPEKNNKKLNTVLIIVIVALLVIVAVVVTVLVMSHSRQNQAAVSETTSAVAQTQEQAQTEPQIQSSSSGVQQPKNRIPGSIGYAYYTDSNGRTWCSLRSAPRQKSKLVARVPNGSQVTILSDQEYDSVKDIYYVYVQYEGYHGWMRADFIE